MNHVEILICIRQNIRREKQKFQDFLFSLFATLAKRQAALCY